MQCDIQAFLDYLAVDKRYSTNTIAAYRNDLHQFLTYVQTACAPDLILSWVDVHVNSVHDYLLFLQGQEYASATVARKIASVKSFLGRLHSEGQLSQDLILELRSPKVKKNLPLSIPPEAVEQLLAEPAKNRTPKALRDKALLETLYATGMRVSELVNLNVEDVDVSAGKITCGAQSRRRRVVPVQSATSLALDHYLTIARQSFAKDAQEYAFFLNHRGKRLTRQGLWLIIREYVEAVGITDPVTPHTLRHSFAAHLLNGGANLQEVQQRLGHASASTTQIYRKMTDEGVFALMIDGAPVSLHKATNEQYSDPIQVGA
ncbi:MAG: tyrosine-type recombinase/integrase [Caldilineaceae bacterium]|nr:tyrosine-type recombinase/integrase [Caldilineaceae bacterium]